MTKHNLPQHHSIRYYGYDYSQEGLYFVTICTQGRLCLFEDIVEEEMVLNDVGRMIEKCWLALKNRFTNIELYEYCIMPNHFHGIMQIIDDVGMVVGVPLVGTRNAENGQPQGIAPTTKIKKSVGDIIRTFKSITTVEYINNIKQHNWPPFNGKLWQRNYYEHIIRNDKSHQKITKYIFENPKYWQTDDYYNQ